MTFCKLLLLFVLLAQVSANFATIESHAEKIGMPSSLVASQFLPNIHQNQNSELFFEENSIFYLSVGFIGIAIAYFCRW